MPFDGSGNFNRVRNWVSDAIAGIKIKADFHDSEDDNLAAGLSNTLTKDGQSQPTANIPMNGKRLVNLGAPTTGTDAATKAYADAIRTFSTAITLTGANPQARIGFTVADVGFGAREAGSLAANSLNRFVWNTSADLSGVDLAMLDDSGNFSIMNGYYLANMAVVTGGTSFVAMSTGFGGLWQFNKATGQWTAYTTTASVAGGASATLQAVAVFNGSTGTVLADAAYTYGPGSGSIYHQNRGVSVGQYRMAGVGNFSWSKSASGLQSGASLTELMNLNDSGDLQTLGSVLAATTGSFVGTATVAVLASSSAGTVFLRPNGRAVTTGQATIASNGDLQILGAVATKASGTAWVNPSDARLKENIADYQKGLAELLQVQPRMFTFKAYPEIGTVVGVIAQEIEAAFPETVKLTEGEADGETVTDLRQFDASALTFALINAVKELSARIDELEAVVQP
jgi:hypothetical protein